MAHKERVRSGQSQIEIERNIIERSLMQAKSFVMANRKPVFYTMIGLLSAIVVTIVAIVVVELVLARDQERFEKIMDEYAKYAVAGDAERSRAAVLDLKKFIDSSYFGFSHNMAFFALGSIHFSGKNYKEADEYLVRFAGKESLTIFAPQALIKAALAREEMGNLKGARELYQLLEEKYGDTVMADQIFFNYGRLCWKMKDVINSRRYYNKVITAFPESSFAVQARKRLFMLGAL